MRFLSSSSRASRSILLVAGALCASVFASACIEASNPYDPDTPLALQAKATLKGRVEIDDAGLDPATRESLLAALRIALFDDEGERVLEGGDPLAAPLLDVTDAGGAFEIDGLTPGAYTLGFENAPTGYDAPAATARTLRPGAVVEVGTLVFTPGFAPGEGPGVIGGEVTAALGDAGDCSVTLFRRLDDRTVLVDAQTTRAQFLFTGLALGTYAIVAEAPGFAQTFVLDLAIGEAGDAALTHDLSGTDAVVLRPRSAVLLPQAGDTVRVRDGVAHARGDSVDLAVVASGVVTGMRFSFDETFLDDADAPVPFSPASPDVTLPLPDVQGALVVYGQLRAESVTGFSFTSDPFELVVVRDTLAPTIESVTLPDLAQDASGAYLAGVAAGASPTVRIDAIDEESAVDEIAMVVTDTDEEPTPASFVARPSAQGAIRIEDTLALSGEGERYAWFFLRDRAGNTSSAARLALVRDTEPPPLLPISVDEAQDGVLYARYATLRFDTASLPADEPLTMVVGAEPLDPDATPVPFAETVVVPVPADLGDGGVVTFVARLLDRAGNDPGDLATTGALTLTLRARLAGSIELLRSNEFVGFDLAGSSISVLSSTGTVLAAGATGPDGTFSFDAPEASDVRLRFARPGWRAVELPMAALVAVPDSAPTVLEPVTLALAEGSVRGVFRRADLASNLTEHGGIAVQVVLDSPTRNYVDEGALTQADGGYVVHGLPATFAGEQYLLRATKDGYSDALASAVVEDNVVTIIGDVGGDPSPIFLGKTSFAFDVCEPGPTCTPGSYFNDDVLRVRLQDTGVDEIRVRARTAFDADDAAPAYQPFPATNDVLVDVSGADGLVDIYLQTRTDGVAGDVLVATITRDRTAPTLIGVERALTPGAYDARFTRFSFVDFVVDADAGLGAVAPLADTPIFARAHGGAASPLSPTAGLPTCAPSVAVCRASLPGAPDAVLEGRYDVGVWACDAAGNCSAPVDTTFIADQTAPSSGNGVQILPAGDYAEVGGVILVGDDDYDLALDVGAARDGGGGPVLDENDDAVADVIAARFSRTESTADALVRVLDPTPVADEVRTGLVLPALPQGDGDTLIYAQLFDGAGNATIAEPNAFVRTVRLDTQAPVGELTINSGATYATSTSVTLGIDVAVPEAGLSRAIGNGAIDCASATYAALTAPATVPHTLAVGDGAKSVRVCIKDAVGNTSATDAAIVLDTVDPVGTLRITDPEGNDDGFATSTTTVTLVMTLPGEDTSAAQMAIVEGTALDCASGATVYEAFSSTKPWPLSAGQGAKNLVACFRDGAGRVTPAAAVARASITVDTSAPAGSLDVVEGRVFGGTHFVGSTTVTARLSGVSADVTQLSIAQGSLNCANPTPAYAPFSANVTVALTAGEGDKTIEACLKDGAGLTTKVSKLVRLDQTAPVGLITLDAGADYSTDLSIAVRVTSAETGLELKVPATDCSPPFGISAFDGDESSAQTISAGDGVRTLGACLRDPAGNTTLLSDSIIVDQTAPSGISIVLASGAAKTKSTTAVPFSVSLPAGVTDITHIAIADRTGLVALNCATATYVALGSTSTVDFNNATNESKRVQACFRDAAGNVLATPAQDTITLDTALVTTSIVLALSGTPTTTVTRVQAITATFGGLAAQDIRVIEVSEQATFADAVPFQVAAGNDVMTLPFTLSGGDGVKTVRARVTDDAGNVASLTNATIRLDTTAPTQPQLNDAGIVTSLSTFNLGGLALASTDTGGSGLRSGGRPYDLIVPTVCPSGTTAMGGGVCQWDGTTIVSVALQTNVENRVQVRGVDQAGNASTSDLLIITQDSTAPSSVTGMSAREDDQMAAITWTRSTSTDVLGYRVHYMLHPGGACPSDASMYDGAFADEGVSPIDVGLSTQITLTGLTNGLAHCVMVTARDRAVPTANEDITPGGTATLSFTPEQTPLYQQGTLTALQLGVSGRIGSVQMRQGLMYIAAQNTGLIELDGSAESCFALTDAAAFQSCTGRVASATALTDPRDMVLSGAFAFVGDSDGVEIYRLSEGSAPIHVVQLAHTNVRGVDVFRDLLAVAHDGGVAFYDTTPLSAASPAAPTLRSTFSAVQSWDVDVQGTLAAVAQSTSVVLVDLTNPAAPVAHARQCAPTSIPLAVRFAGETLYVSNTSSEIHACDVSSGSSPRPEVGAIGGSVSFMRRMDVIGPYLIAVGTYGAMVVDASNPTNIELAAQHTFPSNGANLNGVVAVDGYRVFLSNGTATQLEWHWIADPSSFGQVGTDGGVRVERGVYADADVLVNGERSVSHWGREETVVETAFEPFNGTSTVVGENGFFVSLRDASSGGSGQYTTAYRTEDGSSATSAPVNLGTCFSNAGVVRWPYLILGCANAGIGGTTSSVRVQNLETNALVSSQTVTVFPSGAVEHGASRIAVYGDQVILANTRGSPSNSAPEGITTLTFNPLTGALGAPTLAEAGDFSSVVPVGRRIFYSRDGTGLHIMRMTSPTWTPANTTVVGAAVPRLTPTYLGKPAYVGELMIVPANSDGFHFARISYDTASASYPALEPRRYLKLDRSAAFHAHVMADRIYLTALNRSLEIFEIR